MPKRSQAQPERVDGKINGFAVLLGKAIMCETIRIAQYFAAQCGLCIDVVHLERHPGFGCDAPAAAG